MRLIALLTLPFAMALPALADENADLVAKQKMSAMMRLKKLNVDNAVVVESEHLLLCGAFAEEKLSGWGTTIEKHYSLAMKALKFEMTDNPPKGKVAVYFFAERSRYVLFVGELLNDRVSKDDRGHADGRSDTPYVAVTVLPGDKPTDLDVEACSQIAGALLQNKAGPAVLPSWMKDGFAKAIQMRSAGSAAATERAMLRKWLAWTKDKPSKYTVSDVWAGGGADKKLLSASLMEYFIYGPGSATYAKIVGGLIPQNGQKTTVAAALTMAEIKVDDLDKAWKKWVMTGK
jgi:hypothetical protein